MVQRIGKNNLTNRGAAGLYRKLTDEEREAYKGHEEAEGLVAEGLLRRLSSRRRRTR
jgi:hypothetical protein